MTRLVVLVTALAMLAGASSALADPPSPSHPAGGNGIRGVVPAHGQATKFSRSGSNLSYHGGPVMHANHTHAIYWAPSNFPIDSGYQSVINGFFGNVGAATSAGISSNVYWSDTQYYDGLGNIAYSVGGTDAAVDNDPFPASGCSDSYTPAKCLSDAQIQTELKNYISRHGLPTGPDNLYFVFTPKNVGSCSGPYCAFSYYCAYHSNIGTGANEILYANQPYAETVPSACGSGQRPNNSDADSTLNVASHEHNESITDPLGSAWYDRQGSENGDKCAWNFGTSSGPSGARYNQTINGAHYYLQQEWSNARSGCVLTGT